jgi:hypothetical protein
MALQRPASIRRIDNPHLFEFLQASANVLKMTICDTDAEFAVELSRTALQTGMRRIMPGLCAAAATSVKYHTENTTQAAPQMVLNSRNLRA